MRLEPSTLSATNPKCWVLGFVFLWFFAGSLGHFFATDFFTGIMPTVIPEPLHAPAVYVSGVFECVLALVLWVGRYRATAGIGLMLLTVAVTPANVHMWLNPDQFPAIPQWMLSARLLFQGLLLWMIWWSSRPVQSEAPLGQAH